MVYTCDICGFNHNPNDRYCGKCSVDLKEPKGSEGSPEINKILDEMQELITSISMSEKPKQEDVFKWCGIRGVCNSFEMDFPMFFMIAFALAKGDKYIGFCDCHLCNQGYRQLLAWLVKSKGGAAAKITAQSRDVIIRAKKTEINGLSFKISRSLPEGKEKKTQETSDDKISRASDKTSTGKISVEIDSEVIEDAVIRILKSERGREIIQSVPRKYPKAKGEAGKKTKEKIK
jgi:hypothetical protein